MKRVRTGLLYPISESNLKVRGRKPKSCISYCYPNIFGEGLSVNVHISLKLNKFIQR
jgi:hypothetical protein